MALVNNDGTEHILSLVKLHALESKTPLTLDTLYEELSQALIIHDEHLSQWSPISTMHLPALMPRLSILVIEDNSVKPSELPQLTLPVNLQRCRANDQRWERFRSCEQPDSLDGLSQALLIAKYATFLLESIGDTLFLIFVWLNKEVVRYAEYWQW